MAYAGKHDFVLRFSSLPWESKKEMLIVIDWKHPRSIQRSKHIDINYVLCRVAGRVGIRDALYV